MNASTRAWSILGLALVAGGGASAGVSFWRSDEAPTHPAISFAPVSRTVNVGQTATFAVLASGGALTYQWSRNGEPIPGATGSAYTTAPVSTSDDGARFTVTVANEVGAVTSAPAALSATQTTCAKLGPTGSRARTATDGAGRRRSYELLVPASYPAGAPMAITFVFHGAGGSAEVATRWGLQDAPGARAASIFVFPQGIEFQRNGVGWDDSCGGYDMVFFDHMLADLQADYCIDPGRVYVAGFSWGCDFATALACCRGDVVRGVAAASCSDEFRSSDYTAYANYPCPRASRTAIRFTHDPQSDGDYTAQQFAATSALYRALAGCASTSVPVAPKPCVAYGSCRQPVVECAYPGLGHNVPSTWASESWAFFAQLP